MCYQNDYAKNQKLQELQEKLDDYTFRAEYWKRNYDSVKKDLDNCQRQIKFLREGTL